MDPARWKRVNTLFTAVAHVDPERRAHALLELCPDDEQLRRDVATLLEAHEQTGFVDDLAARLQALTPPEAAPSVAPNRIGRYEVVGQIGRGGMGVVWKARDPALDRMVAVKLIAPGQEFDEAGRRRLIAEARAAAAIDHPSVATVYEIGETEDGRVFLAMAFYEGETLAARLARGPMPIGEAIHTARQIAAGLSAAHARNITHRDLKPANVLLTPGGAVKLLDFGIAKMAGVDDTLPGQLFGTTAYMAPEQWRGERVDARTDVWAFGLVLYEMLTGERPMPLGRGAVVSDDSAPRPSERRPDVPPALDQIVERALRVRADDRQHDGAELAAALDALSGSAQAGSGRERIGRVPVPIASFFGREREVDEIATRLEHARLLTLIGPGGTGKTRLSQQVAVRVGARYADGVAYVSWASTSDPTEACRAALHSE